jgi:KUP system potassium uptake protein
LWALSPYYGLKFLFTHGLPGFFLLSEVILCATGAEALYADMGHLGRKPIVQAWGFVFVALVLNYLGQGAFAIAHPDQKNMLFAMAFQQSPGLYVPFVALTIVATVIASQAMISSMFSIFYQAITTRIAPLLKVDYTSSHLRTQVYIGAINWALLFAVIYVMFHFQESHKLAAAYGLAVTGTMTITGILMSWIFWKKGHPFLLAMSLCVMMVDGIFLCANMSKIPQGGFLSLLIGAFPLMVILVYTYGKQRIGRAILPMPVETFLSQFQREYTARLHIEGTALFLVNNPKKIPPYVINTLFQNHILYEDNVFVSITTSTSAFGISGHFRADLAPGLRVFQVVVGYMEVVNVEHLLRQAGIQEEAIFYGLEELSSNNWVMKAFAFLKKNTPSFVQFYKFNPSRMHGVITHIEV